MTIRSCRKNIREKSAADQQADAIRNSVETVGYANFSRKQLHGKPVQAVKEMLLEAGVNWDELPLEYQRGTCCVKTVELRPTPMGDTVERSIWKVDKRIPMFLKEKREYVEKWV